MTSHRQAPLRFPYRRRRRRWLWLAVVAAAAALIVGVGAQPTDTELRAEPVGQEAPADVPTEADLTPADEEEPQGSEATGVDDGLERSPLVGEVEGLVLHLPAAEAVVVGFHEASSASYGIEPVGRLASNENTTRFDPVADRPDDGVAYHVLSSRGRIHPPTSAVDVVLEDDVPVLSPVSGVVADIREYALYGTYPDHRVEIHPVEAPHLRIVLVHVADVQVGVGDEVIAGVTAIAGTANRFPFASQIDRETEPDRWPHVHLEVQPIDAPRPGDPIEE